MERWSPKALRSYLLHGYLSNLGLLITRTSHFLSRKNEMNNDNNNNNVE